MKDFFLPRIAIFAVCIAIITTMYPPLIINEARTFEDTHFSTTEQRLFEGTTLTPPIIDLPSNEVQYCEACGMAYAIGEPSPFRMTAFDDGTEGLACDYCMAFFALDQRDRDILRAGWENV